MALPRDHRNERFPPAIRVLRAPRGSRWPRPIGRLRGCAHPGSAAPRVQRRQATDRRHADSQGDGPCVAGPPWSIGRRSLAIVRPHPQLHPRHSAAVSRRTTFHRPGSAVDPRGSIVASLRSDVRCRTSICARFFRRRLDVAGRRIDRGASRANRDDENFARCDARPSDAHRSPDRARASVDAGSWPLDTAQA